MANRFRRTRDADLDDGAVATAEREDTRVAPLRRRDRAAEPRAAVMRRRGREEFGGISWGAALLGCLSAFGLAALLITLLSSAGAAIGLADIADAAGDAPPQTVTIGGAALIVVALCLAYFLGGYAAGRMSRFDGLRQGVGVWLWGLIITVGLAVLAVALGDQYNVLSQLDLPRLPVGDEALTTGGVVTLVVALLGTLLAAMAGGRLGEGFHRRVDRHVWDDPAV